VKFGRVTFVATANDGEDGGGSGQEWPGGRHLESAIMISFLGGIFNFNYFPSAVYYI
jgi:hypothetical protein